LAAGIELEYVTRLIRNSHLQPASPTVERWPYPVRIHTLGRPAVVVEGKPIVFYGKAQRRPLELLYFLVANGGREIAVSRLIGALWPDEEGTASRGAFDMALNRLRRLIGVPEALVLHGGRLSLSDQACWIDRRVLERLLGDADGEADLSCGLALLERALGLYQGDFLQGEESGWAVLARERVRARLMRSVKHTGQRLEEAGRWPEATLLYDRARELFPLEEELCRRLLHSHIQQGEYVQASHLYDRCRELFAKVLGVLPSPSTVSLINRLPHRRPA
jgi:two-component SAPR family response regulator